MTDTTMQAAPTVPRPTMAARTLVVPYDGSKSSLRALPVGRALAQRIDGGLVVVPGDVVDAGSAMK